MATKTDVLALVNQLSTGAADQAACGRFFDEVVFDLGQQLWLSNATIIPIANPVVMPDRLIKLTAVLYDARELAEAKLVEMEALNPQWRNVAGDPLAYVVEDEATHAVRLYPFPTDVSRSTPPVPGLEFGSSYPSFNLVVFHTEYRTEIPEYLLWPVALLVLSQEFARPSDHQDPTMATACGKVGQMLLTMVT